MRLSQALKKKNRLAGELVRLQQIMVRENARRNDSVSKTARSEVWDEIIRTSDQLGKLKAAIARANIGVYDKIERMSEYKARIVWIQSIPIREGEEIVPVSYGSEVTTKYTWDSYISREDADKQTNRQTDKTASGDD